MAESYNGEPPIDPTVAAEQEQLPVQVHTVPEYPRPAVHSGMMHRWLARTAGVLTATGVVLAPSVATHAESHAAVSHTEVVPSPDIAPIVDPVPQAVSQKIAEANAADTCETQVGVDDVTSMYRRLWLTHEGKDWTADQYKQYADSLTSRLQRQRERLNIGVLPAEFVRLQSAVEYGVNKLPVSQYEDAARSFFASRGINAVFDWNRDTDDAAYGGLYRSWEPLGEPKDAEEAENVRENILTLMMQLADLPPAVFKDYPVSTIFIGRNVPDVNSDGSMNGAAGMYYDPGHYIALDITTLSNYFRRVPPHEATHNWTFALCYQLMTASQGGKGSDPAMAVLNDGFLYPPSKGGPGMDEQPANAGFTDLQDRWRQPGKIVTESAYGMTNAGEDLAEDIGAGILDVDNAGQLYAEGDAYSDPTILKEKIAYELARFAERHPLDADYIVTTMQLNQLREAIYKAERPVEQNVDLYTKLTHYRSRYDTPKIPYSLPILDAAGRTWNRQIRIYDQTTVLIQRQLDIQYAIQQVLDIPLEHLGVVGK